MDQVICIDDGPNDHYPNWKPKLTKGSIYTVLEKLENKYGVGYKLAEIDSGPAPAFRTARFRPVRRTDIGELRALLTTSPTSPLKCEPLGVD